MGSGCLDPFWLGLCLLGSLWLDPGGKGFLRLDSGWTVSLLTDPWLDLGVLDLTLLDPWVSLEPGTIKFHLNRPR